MSATPVLDVRDLHVTFSTRRGEARAVRGIDLSVAAGEVVALVGESGSGKSVTALAVMGLLPATAAVSGRIHLDGSSLLDLPERELRSLRGDRMAMIFQDPVSALNPVLRIGSQIVEAIRTHRPGTDARTASERAVELLGLVGIARPSEMLRAHPHELSGGMRQRVMIAMAIVNDPQLLIADEPTTALDVTIQAQVMEVLRRAQQATAAGLLLITHDLAVVAEVADRVIVAYGGQVFESADPKTLYHATRNPYTRGLLRSVPRVDMRAPLQAIDGTAPAADDLPGGCVFGPRCPHATELCEEQEPALLTVGDRHMSRCHYAATLPAWQLHERTPT